MGVYSDVQHQSGGNPGTFNVLMNQDYYGLHASVGIQVNGGSWREYSMVYAGKKDANSKWAFTPSAEFPAGAVVKYYFHGWDDWGGSIWDSNLGANFSFSPAAPSPVNRIADGVWGNVQVTGNGMGYVQPNIWIDIKVQSLSPVKDVGVVWSTDGTNWHTTPAVFEASLASGYEQWGVDLQPVGTIYYTRWATYWSDKPGAQNTAPQVSDSTGIWTAIGTSKAVQYAIYYRVLNPYSNGIPIPGSNATYWDNNGGRNYQVAVYPFYYPQ
jgi:hypothetical protein